MAIITSNEYDCIDFVNGSDTNRHFLKDTAARAIIANDYDSTATYSIGDYCIYNGTLYYCNTAISTAQAWTEAHWTDITVTDALKDIQKDIGEVTQISEVVSVNSLDATNGGWKGEVGDTITASSSSSYRHYSINHYAGYTYTFKVRRSTSATYSHYIYAVDMNNVILYTWGEPAATDKTTTFYENINPPEGTVKMCVTTYGDTTTLGLTKFYFEDLASQVSITKAHSDAEKLAGEALRKFGAKMSNIITKNSTNSCLNFAFITDTHVGTDVYGQSGFRNLDLFAAVANSGLPKFAVHCGDISTAKPTTTRADYMGFLSEAMAHMSNINVPLYIAMGNHDCNGDEENTVANAINAQDWLYLTQLKAQADVQSNQYASGYFYVDYDEFKIRVIVLDSYYYDTASLETTKVKSAFPTGEGAWLGSTALNLTSKSVPSDWSVLIFVHKISDYSASSALWNVIDAFRSGTDVTKYDTAMNFSQQGSGNLIAIIQGHEHGDAYVSANGANFITVTAGKGISSNIGTIEQYAVSMFTIDPVARKIYETRIGRGTDREYTY